MAEAEGKKGDDIIPKEEKALEQSEPEFVFALRDINGELISCWKDVFGDDCYNKYFEISEGDIFKKAPSADAIVSPANSFGFMDGGIDMVYSLYFGWQMQTRLQDVLRNKHDGECLVGQCVIIPAYPPTEKFSDRKIDIDRNEGKAIKYLISAPTMRVPVDVSTTCNAYLAFRGIILAAREFNRELKENGDKLGLGPIKKILCPGLGTAVGMMPAYRCAYQMKEAFDALILRTIPMLICPGALIDVTKHHWAMESAEKKEKK
ncbi:hypothetical protein LOD99_2699 [Oopsacas minuta]|uniref:Macro domain-containing protein n=1 Tax=Oopsacas minuta TaxID=111878 RepID=A0AAV7K2Q4_9METZ|nr:hypothetical protein LOD99_2699 [Oopsacas minuta]